MTQSIRPTPEQWGVILQHSALIKSAAMKHHRFSGATTLEDFHQDLIMKIAQRWASYDPQRSSVSTWVYWTARSLASHQRSKWLLRKDQSNLVDHHVRGDGNAYRLETLTRDWAADGYSHGDSVFSDGSSWGTQEQIVSHVSFSDLMGRIERSATPQQLRAVQSVLEEWNTREIEDRTGATRQARNSCLRHLRARLVQP